MNEKGGEIMDIHALLFEMMNEQQNKTEDNVSKTDNNQSELQRIKSALDDLDRARMERKNRTMQNETKQNDITSIEHSSLISRINQAESENRELKETLSRIAKREIDTNSITRIVKQLTDGGIAEVTLTLRTAKYFQE